MSRQAWPGWSRQDPTGHDLAGMARPDRAGSDTAGRGRLDRAGARGHSTRRRRLATGSRGPGRAGIASSARARPYSCPIAAGDWQRTTKVDWYPHYIIDYQRDTLHLTTLEHGAYRLLIDAYMLHGKPLPDNDAVLAKIVGLEPDQWSSIAPTILAFFVTRDGRVSHKRCEHELNKQAKRRSDMAERQRRNRLKNNDPVTRESRVRGQDIRRQEEEEPSPLRSVGTGVPDKVRRIVRQTSSSLNGEALTKTQIKGLWEQKICTWICQHETPERAGAIIDAYTAGEKWAKTEFDQIDAQLKSPG